MFLLRLVQSRLRLVDGLLSACALLPPGRFFPGLRAPATLALPFVRLSRLPVRRIVRLDRRFLRFGRWPRGWFLASIPAKVLRQFGVFAEPSAGSHRTLEDDARFRHGRGDDVWIGAFLRHTLMEKIAVGAPRFQGGLHRRRCDGLLEEAQRGLVGLQLPRHAALPRRRPLSYLHRERGIAKQAKSAAADASGPTW